MENKKKKKVNYFIWAFFLIVFLAVSVFYLIQQDDEIRKSKKEQEQAKTDKGRKKNSKETRIKEKNKKESLTKKVLNQILEPIDKISPVEASRTKNKKYKVFYHQRTNEYSKINKNRWIELIFLENTLEGRYKPFFIDHFKCKWVKLERGESGPRGPAGFGGGYPKKIYRVRIALGRNKKEFEVPPDRKYVITAINNKWFGNDIDLKLRSRFFKTPSLEEVKKGEFYKIPIVIERQKIVELEKKKAEAQKRKKERKKQLQQGSIKIPDLQYSFRDSEKQRKELGNGGFRTTYYYYQGVYDLIGTEHEQNNHWQIHPGQFEQAAKEKVDLGGVLVVYNTRSVTTPDFGNYKDRAYLSYLKKNVSSRTVQIKEEADFVWADQKIHTGTVNVLEMMEEDKEENVISVYLAKPNKQVPEKAPEPFGIPGFLVIYKNRLWSGNKIVGVKGDETENIGKDDLIIEKQQEDPTQVKMEAPEGKYEVWVKVKGKEKKKEEKRRIKKSYHWPPK